MRDEINIPWTHHLLNAVMRVVMPAFLRIDMQGREHTPRTGALIIATNHTNFLDPAISAGYLRPDVLPMAKVELFKFPASLLFNAYGAFPVRRGEGDLAALRHALQILRQGHVMYISPEGTRTKSGTLETAHEGTALIAIKSGAPILPVALWGGKKFLHSLTHLRRTPIGMRIGEPLGVVPLQGKPTRPVLRAITDEIMYYIARLLPAEYRGRYSDVEVMVPRYVLPQSQLQAQVTPRNVEEVMPLAD